jgi:hypothetical protein
MNYDEMQQLSLPIKDSATFKKSRSLFMEIAATKVTFSL